MILRLTLLGLIGTGCAACGSILWFATPPTAHAAPTATRLGPLSLAIAAPDPVLIPPEIPPKTPQSAPIETPPASPPPPTLRVFAGTGDGREFRF